MFKNFLLLPWNDIPGYYNHHFPQPHFKNLFQEIYSLEKERFDSVFENKVRKNNDLNHWLFRYWNLESGNYVPQANSFGEYILLSEAERLEKSILQGKAKVFCVNDDECSNREFDKNIELLLKIFREKFPNKSRFEK